MTNGRRRKINIKDLRLDFFSTNRGENYDNTEFRRIIEVNRTVKDETTQADTEIIDKAVKIMISGKGTRRNSVTLVPVKSLSLEEFTFPFSNNTKIRNTLRLQLMPYEAAGDVEIFPAVLTKTGRTTAGIVWYVSPQELDIPELPYDTGTHNKIWPAPLPFVSQLDAYDGNGVTMWVDEQNLSSILWQNNKPVLYRWKRFTDNDNTDKELAWYDSYCNAREINRGGNFVVDVRGDIDEDDEEQFCEIVNQSVKICPWIKSVNLSKSAIEGAIGLERSIRYLTRASCWLLVLGVIALGTGLLKWYSLGEQIQEIRGRSENFYRQVFDPDHTGRISNPLTLARDRLADLTGTGQDSHPLEEVLADLGDIFTQGQSMDVTLDVIRYNSEGIDCTGSAPDMTTILNFRKAWENKARLAQVDNTQSVSGIGYRFDLRVRW